MSVSSPRELPGYDYVSPGLEIVRPDAAFPKMITGDTRVPQWRWLRRWVEHNWYCDRRNPDAGFVSRDEAAILYNAARLVRGRPCLEIGCWRGWSTVHLALGSGMLDVIDPLIANPSVAESIRRSCEAAGVLDAITFHAGFSPAAVDALGSVIVKKWSLVFVDGDHEGDAPRLDAEAVMRNAAETAMVLFHDLASPYVAAGLGVLRNAGWRTMIYQTMQIMGVAWRGNIEPPEHTPDPTVFWTLPSHLAGYHVSNWKRPTIRADGGWWAGMTMTDRRDVAMMRAQVAEDAATAFLLKANEASQEIVRRDAQIADLGVRLEVHRTELATLHEMAARRDAQIADLGVRLEVHRTELATLHEVLAAHRTDLAALHEVAARRDAQIGELARRLATLQELAVEQQDLVMKLSSNATAWEREVTGLAGFARFMTERRVLLGLLRRSASERFKAIHVHTAVAEIDHLLPSELLHWLLRRRTLLGLARRSRLAGEAIVMRAMAESLRNVLARSFDGLREFTRHHASMAAVVSSSLGVLDDLDGCLWIGASSKPTLANHLRSVGWGPKAAPFPRFPGRLLRQCFRDSALGDAAELAWVKQVMHGWQPPSDTDALEAATALVRDSGLFDARFYGRQAGISDDRTDAAAHYVLVGDALGLSPSESFDSAYYGDRNPDVVAHGQNRLLHYLAYGCNEGRHPLPLPPLHVNEGRIDQLRENVILVVHEASRTGAPVLGWNIAQHLATRYNVFIVTLGRGPLMEDFKALSAAMYGPFEHEHRHPVDIEYGLRRLLDERTFKYAIINSCESRLVIDVCAKWLIPTVMLMHEFGSYVYASDSLRAAFDMASEIVFPAQIVASSSLEVHPPLRERPIRILPQGVCMLPGGTTASLAQSAPGVHDLARIHNEGSFIVLGAGTVDYRKGVDLFLATAMVVIRDAADRRVHFIWVGRGYRPREDMGYSIYLLEQLERSGLQDHVTFLEDVPDLEPIYALTDAFLLSSRLDPLPNVSIDAAHRGIPIVCFKGASGTANLLLSDPETARGVVDHLDPVAAGHEILSLAHDYDHYTRTSAATKHLAKSVFDMAKYVDAIDALGAAASIRAARKREDADLLCSTEDFDQDMFLGPKPSFESRARSVRCAVARSGMHRDHHARRTAPGFNPSIWCSENSARDAGDPLAEFVRAGRPGGPWFTPVLRPVEDPARLDAAGVRALLHVHVSNTDQATDLLMRLQTNRLRVDLLVNTDAESKAELIRGALSSFDRGAIHVIAAGVEGESAVRWLLSEMEQSEWGVHNVIGHLHDGSDDSGDASMDFHWTALLGGRRPMLDRILHAFAVQPALGLVFPSDPLLPGPDVTVDYPTGGMFWARRATLDRLRDNGLSCSTRALPQACEAAGLTQAVTHVPGVFR